MAEKNFEKISDEEFEDMLAEGFGEPPEDDVANLVSPWHASIKRVLWGFALTLLNLEFLYLKYILPAIGFFMLIFGFRALRKENGFFAAAYVLVWVRSAHFFSSLIINASAIHTEIYDSDLMWALAYSGVAVLLATVFCFALGFRAILRKAGEENGEKWIWWLVAWYTVFSAVAIISVESTLIALLFMACFVFIVLGIARISKSLSWTGYAITPAKVRVSDKQICAAVSGIVIIGIVTVTIFGGKYPMQWQPEENEMSEEALEVMAELEELGFPKDILSDLTEEEILACKGATYIDIKTKEYPLNEGRNVLERTEQNGIVHLTQRTEYDVYELVITHIVVTLPSERSRVRVFHHFRLQAEASYYGTEMFDVVPIYHDDWEKSSGVSGRVLYDDGKTYTSPYYSFEEKNVQSWFSTEPHIYAAFSLSNEGTNKRGYVSYEATLEKELSIDVNAWVSYTHKTGRFIYPMQSTKDIQSSSFSQDGFIRISNTFLYTHEYTNKNEE